MYSIDQKGKAEKEGKGNKEQMEQTQNKQDDRLKSGNTDNHIKCK